MAAPMMASRPVFLHRLAGARVSSPTISATIRVFLSERSFASSTKLWQDLQTSSKGLHARSVALLRLPRRATRSDVEALLKSNGYDVKKVQLRLDKFTFHNDTRCFVELGSEQQAADAVKTLNETIFQAQTVYVKPLKEDFQWDPIPPKHGEEGSRFFYDEGNQAEDAIKPLVEGRRVILSVQTPGWGEKKLRVGLRSKLSLRIMRQTFDKYGLESISGLQPFFGGMKEEPQMLCFLDFKTQDGAERAIQDLHDTEIEGRKVWIRLSQPAPWRAHHIGKVDSALLTKLQTQGILPEETYEDKFSTPKTRKVKK